MLPSAMKSADSPRSVHRFLRFEDDEGKDSNAKNVATESNSNPQSPTPPPTIVKYDDQLPLGSSSSSSSVKRNFVIRKPSCSSSDASHSAPAEGRYMDQLPLGCPPQYSGARPKPKKILRDYAFPQQNSSSSPPAVTARYTDQLALSMTSTATTSSSSSSSGSLPENNWNLVHQKPNRVPSATTTASWRRSAAVATISAPPLVQAAASTSTSPDKNQVTKLIRNFENAATTRMSRQSHCAMMIQMAFRRYQARQQLRAKQAAHARNLPRLIAAVKIQTALRAWVGRMKARLASLERDLATTQASKEYCLAHVERKLQDDKKSFCETEHFKAGETFRTAVRSVVKIQSTIADYRKANKKFRTQNQTLTEASAILSQKCTDERAKHQAQLQDIAALEAEIEKLKREEKRLTASAAVYPKFVRQFSETLEQVNEHAEVEHKSKMAFKQTIAKIMDLVKESCTDDEELVHEIVHMGTATFLTDTKEPRDFEKEVIGVGGVKKKGHFTDISETETSETSYSEDDDDEEEDEHPELLLAKMLQDGAAVESLETTAIQLK